MLDLLLYLLVGGCAGLLAGLFGIGGGLIVVPALVFSFGLQGVSPAVLTHMAVGTSLATIVITSISSVRAHHALGAVNWPVVLRMAPGIALGVWLGAMVAAGLSGPILQLIIGLFAWAVAAQMGFGLKPKPSREVPGAPVLLAVGGGIGWASALFGIGGGSLTVPFLSWCNVSMQRAVATSAACGLPIALVGALANVVEGWGRPELPALSSGFVYWPAMLGIALASAPAAKVGARLAHRWPAERLKKMFALLLLLIGTRFVLGYFWQ